MKKIFLILLITLLTKNINAQTGVPDTLAYLNTIVADKANYIGQPFSVLFNSLQIQTKYFHPIRAVVYNKNKETSTSFAFYYPQDGLDDMYLTYPCLNVYWQTPLDATQSDSIWENNNGGGWNTTAYNFYKNAIISDIKVRE